MIIYDTEFQLGVIYYLYIFIACYYMNVFINKDIKLHLYNKKTNKNVPMKPWLTGLLCSLFSMGWPIIFFKLIKEENDDENSRH